MKHAEPKELKNFWFLQNWSIYPNDTLVCVGMTTKEVAALIRKNDKKLGWRKGVAELLEKEDLSGDKGGFLSHKDASYSILILNDWTGSWENYETLIHETNHAVLIMLWQKRGMEGELEALAYAQAYLFRQIRRRIDERQFPKFYKNKKK